MQNCREGYGEHPCDKRHTKTVLLECFPEFEIKGGICVDSGVFTEFTEEDELWRVDERESREHVAARARAVLDRIFGDEELKGNHCK
jgi:hypothetical protein